jgi:hypothetical protein
MSTRKLTPALEVEIMTKAAEGFSSRAIAAHLLEEHGVRLTFQTIAAYLARTREERGAITQAVVREKLAGVVVPGLDALGRETERVRRLCLRLYRQTKNLDSMNAVALVRSYLAAADQLRKSVETTMRLAGADAPDQAHVEMLDAARRVGDRLERLGERLDPADSPPEGQIVR